MGGFMREEFMINWVDQWLHQLFNAFNRLSYRDDIMIEHRHWSIGKTHKDTTVARMYEADGPEKKSDKLWYKLTKERISDVNKLSNYLQLAPDWTKVDTVEINL